MRGVITTLPVATESYEHDSESRFRRDLEQVIYIMQSRLDELETVRGDSLARGLARKNALTFKASIETMTR